MDQQHVGNFPVQEPQNAGSATAPDASSPLPTITAKEERGFLELSPDALVIDDQQGTILLVNELAAALFGYRQEELAGQQLEVLLPGRFRASHVAHRARYVAAPRRRPMGAGLDLVGKRKDGSEFPVDISLRPLLVEQELHVVGAIRDISFQRGLERERARQAERLARQQALINLAHDAILMRDSISRILFWNQGAEELYGYDEQEALGRVAYTLLQTRFPSSQAAIDEQLACTGRWEGELVHTRKDGHLVIVESRQILVRDEQDASPTILEINRDITERRQMEQAQSQIQSETLAQRTFLQEVLDALPGSIAVVRGQEARLVLTNRAQADLWGATWAVGQPMDEFLKAHQIQILDSQGRPFPPQDWATMRALRGETVLQFQEVIQKRGGGSLPILVNAVPLSPPTIPQAGMAEGDRSDPMHGQGEPLALVIHQNVRRLKEIEALKDEFISIAAHELRQPLSALKGAVGTLVRQSARGHGPKLAEWQQEMLDELEQATDQLADLTEDLLDVSRLQAGQVLLQCAPTNLVSLLQRLVARLLKTTSRHRLEVRTEHATLVATLDPRRIEQVLSNLLTNAIKYSPQGGPVIVELAAGVGAQTVEIRVQDWGMGIPRHQQAQIFGRFVRADNAQAAGIRGTGLGLYLARALVEQHGGQLWFTSMEGEGTTFFLTLPLLASPQAGQEEG